MMVAAARFQARLAVGQPDRLGWDRVTKGRPFGVGEATRGISGGTVRRSGLLVMLHRCPPAVIRPRALRDRRG